MTRSEKKQQTESSTVPVSETINPEVTITEAFSGS